MKDKFFIVVILVLVGVVFFMNITKPKPVDLNKYIKIGGKEYIEISSRVDTTTVTDTIKVPEYVPVPTNIPVPYPVPADVDTTAILKDYFAKIPYTDIVALDTIGTIQINDTISKNRIISRSFVFDYKIPIIRETLIVKEKPVNQLYFGGGINFDQTDFLNSTNVGLLFKSKKDKIFLINIGMSLNGNTVKSYIGGGLYWKIRFKK